MGGRSPLNFLPGNLKSTTTGLFQPQTLKVDRTRGDRASRLAIKPTHNLETLTSFVGGEQEP